MDASLPNTFTAYGGAVDQRAWSAARAGRLGAVASVVRSMTTRLDDVPHTGGMRYEDGSPRVPSVAVSTMGAERIARLLDSGERVELFLQTSSHWEDDAQSANVVGELLGSERPEEILVVGGHIDGWDSTSGREGRRRGRSGWGEDHEADFEAQLTPTAAPAWTETGRRAGDV